MKYVVVCVVYPVPESMTSFHWKVPELTAETLRVSVCAEELTVNAELTILPDVTLA